MVNRYYIRITLPLPGVPEAGVLPLNNNETVGLWRGTKSANDGNAISPADLCGDDICAALRYFCRASAERAAGVLNGEGYDATVVRYFR